MQDDQNQKEEEKRKYKDYRDLVMQQDPLLEEVPSAKGQEASESTEQEEQSTDTEFTQELKQTVKQEKQEREVLIQQAGEQLEQFQEVQQTNPVVNQAIAVNRQQDLEKKKQAIVNLKVLEGIGKMVEGEIQDLETIKLEREAERQVEDAEQQEQEMVAGEALNLIQQEAQKKAQQELERQVQIKKIQEARKKQAELDEKQRKKAEKKKKKAKKGFLGLVKKEVNPTSPGKTLKVVPGLNWISGYFETIIP